MLKNIFKWILHIFTLLTNVRYIKGEDKKVLISGEDIKENKKNCFEPY